MDPHGFVYRGRMAECLNPLFLLYKLLELILLKKEADGHGLMIPRIKPEFSLMITAFSILTG
jgi:hypothetical protein